MAENNLIEPGKKAAAFTAKDQDGKLHRLKDYLGKWVILYFYPKDNTSGCTKQACQFRDEKPKFSRNKAVILGVSPDSEKSHTNFIANQELNFTLLADTEKVICEKYGVWQKKKNYGREYMGVVRTTYLIDPTGKVAYRWDKVKVADHAQAVMEKLKELK